MKLVLFTSPSCKPCESLKQYLKDSHSELPYETINAMDDFESAMKYQVRGTPTFLLLNENGDKVGSSVGFSTPEHKDNVEKVILQFNKY